VRSKRGAVHPLCSATRLPPALVNDARRFITSRDKGRYAVNASGNWRITFGRTEGDATDVDLETITEDGLMTKKRPKRALPPMHPGELLREEILPAVSYSV
jgi:hypothetical protein